jgi:hypothetical protein
MSLNANLCQSISKRMPLHGPMTFFHMHQIEEVPAGLPFQIERLWQPGAAQWSGRRHRLTLAHPARHRMQTHGAPHILSSPP